MGTIMDAGLGHLREREQRLFAWALLASLIGHAVLMLGLPGFPASVTYTPPGALVARLEHAPTADTPAPERAQQRAPLPIRESAPVITRPDPAPQAYAVPEVPAATPPAEPQPVSPSDAAEARLQPGAAQPAFDPNSLAQYRIAVMETAARYKRYPRVASENNWQGRVDVRLAVRASGEIAAIDVKSSAGYAALDRQALDMVRAASARIALPESLLGREFTIDIPVVFSLRDPAG